MANPTAIREAMERLKAENRSSSVPPNLHLTESAHKNCGTCLHFKENKCSLYDYRVNPNEVCDSWSPLPE